MAGEDAGDAFTNMIRRMAAQLADMVIQMLIIKPLMNSLFGGLGGGIGGIGAGVGLFHQGGVVGQSAVPMRRVDPRIFAGAPRFATGGIVGLRPGEVPIIAHKGEIVIPNARRVAGSGAGRIDNSVHQQNRITVDVSQSGFVAANNDDAKAVGDQINRAVQVILVKESRPGGLLRRG
jgi:hypothetical protein